LIATLASRVRWRGGFPDFVALDVEGAAAATWSVTLHEGAEALVARDEIVSH